MGGSPAEPAEPASLHAPSAEEIADNVNPEKLLPGENPASPYPEDWEHWARVYGELLELKDELLGKAESSMARMGEDSRREAEFDTRLLAGQAERYRRRLAYWRERAREALAKTGE